MKRLRSKLTYANVIATMALFIALGGASYAAVKLPKNSVGSKQIKDNAVTGAKIKNGAVTGSKIALSSLGTVPTAASAGRADSAVRADSAGRADSAVRADSAANAANATHATNADTAGFATSAETAINAAQLGGVPVDGFMGASRFAFGSASTDGAAQTLFTLGGLEVKTVASAGTAFKVQVKNLTSDTWEFGSSTTTGVTVVSPGGGGLFAEPTTRAMSAFGVDTKHPANAITIQCGSDNGPNLVYCFGQISPAA
jgi:hypothetical protein